MLTRRAFAASVATLVAIRSPAIAQSTPITLIVPFAAGGPTDVIGRIAADGMARALGQRIVVENVAGAGGATGVLRAARSAPDGRTLVIGNLGTHGAAPSATPNLPYDPQADFEPVGLIASTPILLVIRENLPAANLREFVALMRDKPDAFSFGHAGQGVTSHTAALLLLSVMGARQTGVPYRGTAPALNDMLAGVLDFICDQSVIMVEQVKSGKVRALAVASKARLASLPDVPTSAEAGLPDFAITAWNAVFAPKGTDAAIIAAYNKALGAALEEPDLRQRLAAFDAEIPASGEARTSEALRRHVVSEVERWKRIVR
ncbi:MAG: tripartite tricarboxylate transporter substrate-binding protein [Beijerinckiaceae bacterium]